jgi:hypothetical protein
MNKPMELPGQITISRISGDGTHPMRIRITDQVSFAILCDFELSFENFARALTSEAYIPGQLKFFNEAPIGKRRETKAELVPVNLLGNKEEAVSAMEAFEINGWKGQRDDLFNPHCSVRNERDRLQRVRFVRFVETT